MTFRRLLAIAVIFAGSSVAWSILGSSVLARTGQFDGQLEREVLLLWGGPHRQEAPSAWIEQPDTKTESVATTEPDGRVTRSQVAKAVVRRLPVPLESTRATADLELEHRRKGLLWYATYTVAFSGTYTFRNVEAVPRALHVRFPLPAENALFDDFAFTINGRPAALAGDVTKEMTASVTAAPGEVVAVDVRYRSRGLGTWTYAFVPAAESGTAQVRDFQLTIHTNVENIDFPAGSISPTSKTRAADGWQLQWTFTNLLSGQPIGVTLPEKLNPGPFAARVTAFFFEGFTGLAITIGAVVTLFVLMQITARVSWDAVFADGIASSPLQKEVSRV